MTDMATKARGKGERIRCPTLPALPVLLALATVSCTGQFIEQVPPAAPQAAAPVTAIQPAELTPGAQREHARILAAYGGEYQDERLQAHLAQTVDRLVTASERPDLKYRVTILNSPAINAFALSGGQVYVTRGLIALANDTSELSSVLAHEMAHVIARHASFRADQVRQAEIFSRVASELLGDPQMGELALARSKIALASFSRAQELEADGIGVGIAARAGYDPYGAQRFLTSMALNSALKSRGGSSGSATEARPPDFFSSHPSTPDRIRNARANARQYVGPGTAKRDKNEYLALIDGIVYGDDPSAGFVRGRRFLHPKLGFTYTAPEGFVLDNTALAVFGIKDGGAQALRLDVLNAPVEVTPAEYLNSGWIDSIDPKTIQQTTVNGMPAATAVARNELWTLRLYVVRLGNDAYRFIFAAKQPTEASERMFRESLASFRRISAAEAAAARPLRIKVVKVAAGATVESLARRMGFVDRPVEQIRVLNELSPGDRLKQGDLVKILVE